MGSFPHVYTQPQLAEQTRLACQTRQLPTILSDKYLNKLQRALALKTKLAINVTYGTAKKKRPGYLVGNLVATNWPIEKALHAIGYNQIPTK